MVLVVGCDIIIHTDKNKPQPTNIAQETPVSIIVQSGTDTKFGDSSDDSNAPKLLLPSYAFNVQSYGGTFVKFSLVINGKTRTFFGNGESGSYSELSQ